MTDMGVPAYLVASSVIGVLAQRLVRKICTRCKVSYMPPDSVLQDAGIPLDVAKRTKISKGKGCPYCQKSGYRGRIGIYELMIVSNKVRESMFQSKMTAEIRDLAIGEGMTTLYTDGIRKVLNGITTLEEVYRNAKRTEQDDRAIALMLKEFA
jgi:type IV pilus assembly protein PilB